MKTRFAPSPTGFLHIGGFRTALFAYLHAKVNSGDFLLRIEDTDRERFVEGGLENILQSLYWAGIVPDEGVILDNGDIKQKGDNGPYVQSERLNIYREHIEKLFAGGNAYHCFCTKERLDELRKEQEANKQPTGYDGHCSKIDKSELEEKLKTNTPHVIRLKVPKGETVSWTDLVRGLVEFNTDTVDDQVLIKSDGFPTYHFAVVVDDHLMGITDVIRGEEWVSSTPKHLLLYKYFGWDAPNYAHLPLLVNEKKQKLSKRHGDVSVYDFKEKGYLPEAMVNFVAFLGWNPGDEREIFSLSELEKEFDIARTGKSAAVFNIEKLNWMCGQYIKKMDDKKLAELVLPYLHNAGLAEGIEEKKLLSLVKMSKDRMSKLSDIVDLSAFVFAENLEYDKSLLVWKKSDEETTRKNLEALHDFLETIDESDWIAEKLEEIVQKWIKDNDYTVGEILWPMRVALSGQKNSPGPFELAEVLGREGGLSRLKL